MTDAAALRTALEKSMKSHLMSDVRPTAMLLSRRAGFLGHFGDRRSTPRAAWKEDQNTVAKPVGPQLHSLHRRAGRLAGSALRAGWPTILGTVPWRSRFTVRKAWTPSPT